MIEARIHIPIEPSYDRWRHLMALAEVGTEMNAEWFGAQLDRTDAARADGFEMPDVPCCISCARPKIKYLPPPSGAKQFCQNWWSAPDVLERGRANCLDAAMFDAGAARAEGKEASTLLEPVGEPVIPGDPYSTIDFHAVAIIDGQRIDSSAKLVKESTCACGG